MIGWNQEKSHFSNTGKIFAKQGFQMGYNIRKHKDLPNPMTIYYLLSIQNTAQIFPR